MGDAVIADYKKKAVSAEAEIRNLEQELRTLTKLMQNGDVSNSKSAELQKLQSDNSKLKHRLAILKRAVEKEEREGGQVAASGTSMQSIQSQLIAVFEQAIAAAFPDVPDAQAMVIPAGNPKFGDYQCNSAMQICKLLKGQGINSNPREVATKILNAVPSSPLIEKMEVAGAGFVNVWLSKVYGQEKIQNLLLHGATPPAQEKRLRVVIDFSSPNIAKEMHVGHLRSTIIGDSVCRLLEYLGHDVVRVNHVGDWGTQFGMLIAHLEDQFPNFRTEAPPISDLQAFYKESKTLFDSDPEFKKRAYASVVKLQAHDPDYIRAWQLICDVSRAAFKTIYDRLDIRIEEKGESFYHSRMLDVVEMLKKGNFLEEDEGRLVMWGENKIPSIPLTVVKSDGGFTYDTSDMACIRYRIEEERGDWLIYITDAGQASHFEVIYACARRCGILDLNKTRVDHLGFGVVLGEDKKKFKTRSGDTIKLTELLDEGLKRAMDKLCEKGRDKELSAAELKAAQEAVAYGCIKYADLSHNSNREYVFSFDKMLDDKGNTAVYLLYMYTRICSIARTAGVSPEQLQAAAASTPISLDHEKEWKLAKVLLRFPEVLLKMLKDLLMHQLCEYLYDVSTTFSEFYDVCYCVEKNSSGEICKVHMGRLLLCEATAKVMAQCFNILGLKPVTRM